MTKTDIGLRQAALLCQMEYSDRLKFLAEGFPIILESARSLWAASRKLETFTREMDILESHAEEEAAKILILMDVVRCPSKIVSSKLGNMTKWFYDHLARLIYARSTSWKPVNLKQLREYVDDERMGHYRDGEFGEYILPNWEIFNRESKLYADIEVYEDKNPSWHVPGGNNSPLPPLKPFSLELAESFSALGLFKLEGLKTVAEIWNEIEFIETEGFQESRSLMFRLIKRIIEDEIPTPYAEQSHVDCLNKLWQMPMYNLDFKLTAIPLETLQEERTAQFAREIGAF